MGHKNETEMGRAIRISADLSWVSGYLETASKRGEPITPKTAMQLASFLDKACASVMGNPTISAPADNPCGEPRNHGEEIKNALAMRGNRNEPE